MPSLEDIVLASPEPAPDIRSLLVPVDDYGLLVGSGRQVLLLNAAKRRGVENGAVESGCFKLPPGFLKPECEEPVVPPRHVSPVNVLRVFERTLALPGLSRDLAESLRPILEEVRLAQSGVSDTGIEAIVFPHGEADYGEAGAQAEWKKLPLIDTVFELLASESGPVENTAESWRHLIAALERTPAFEMRYSSTEEGIHLLESIARECRKS